MEIGRALLKCESEIAATHNWRLTSLMHSQLEILPKYFPSDFIYSYFVPMTFFRVLHAVSSKHNYTTRDKIYNLIACSILLFTSRGQYLFVSLQEHCFFSFYVTI